MARPLPLLLSLPDQPSPAAPLPRSASSCSTSSCSSSSLSASSCHCCRHLGVGYQAGSAPDTRRWSNPPYFYSSWKVARL
ncbi:hypothetical protein PF005_g33373 [Phytophthora fragariae]|uniref:Uncharacterized protein n=1 Tax=Phytophthora fragariae TaxID=53985 RepID=A0A6A3VUN4_9STRA|nr:hypothetical protein PF003_g25497 [Phytophthora fragariae]KAE9155205.1 hypothetical protein PF005_g33373 [Phytophthora fragariae]KAE9167814.1 hypothetical protein PF002_g30779 [Phytophthora fragariae]KAE9269105.1 hypothetical protein PF008_g30952 [Phytophthora fragariae]